MIHYSSSESSVHSYFRRAVKMLYNHVRFGRSDLHSVGSYIDSNISLYICRTSGTTNANRGDLNFLRAYRVEKKYFDYLCDLRLCWKILDLLLEAAASFEDSILPENCTVRDSIIDSIVAKFY